MVHCERCGVESAPVGGAFDYCVACGLFVCRACWHPTDFCTTCQPAMVRPSAARDLAVLRRVDRRFREAEREAESLRGVIATRERGEALGSEVACLELKVASASRARDQVLGGRISARRRRKLEPLTHRIDRHAAASHTATARVASALALPPSPEVRAEGSPGWFAPVRGVLPSVRWASAAVAVLFVAVVLASFASRAGRPPGEGTLSGVPSLAPGALPSPSVSGPSAASASAPAQSPIAMEATFDDLRIGPITDVPWQQPPEGARVVAFPTPFDRSIEVRTPSGEALEACMSPGVESVVQSLSADVRLGADPGTVATVTLKGGNAGSVQIDFGADALNLTHRGAPVGSAAGIEPEAWHHVGVAVAANGVQVRLTPIDGGASVDIPGEIGELPPAQAICFGVSGEAGASVHYDNVAIVYRRSSEQ